MHFTKVTYKNLQSAGNTPIVIELDRNKTTLVSGQNGSGKSTLTESIVYALFGKTMKKVKLAGIINTKNKNNLVVELSFSQNGSDYMVRRGEKPKKFEIFKDDELIDQTANARDYQTMLEKIIGFDFKLFTQTVVLSKEKYVAFMDLDPSSRRKIIEDILDINIFTYMNDIVKNISNENKNSLADLRHTRSMNQQKIESQERLISESSNSNDSLIKDIKKENTALGIQTEEIQTEIDVLIVERDALVSTTDYTKELQTLVIKKEKFQKFGVQFTSIIKEQKKTMSFFTENDVCPTCAHDIDEAEKQGHIDSCTTEITKIQDASQVMIDNLTPILAEIASIQDEIKAINDKNQNFNSEINNHEREISSNRRVVESNMRRIAKLSETDDVALYEKELVSLVSELEASDKSFNELTTLSEDYDSIKAMLKDDGVKSTIIKEYIDFINQKINEYLQAMGYYVNITLDEGFNETINSINKQGFTYDNLSTGQKSRVNLAIWLALQEISQIKNSGVSSLLFLDEILENLDANGVQDFMKLIDTKMGNKNVFVISQRADEFRDFFRSDLTFKLDSQDFTVLG